jgi:hypothetical protein
VHGEPDTKKKARRAGPASRRLLRWDVLVRARTAAAGSEPRHRDDNRYTNNCPAQAATGRHKQAAANACCLDSSVPSCRLASHSRGSIGSRAADFKLAATTRAGSVRRKCVPPPAPQSPRGCAGNRKGDVVSISDDSKSGTARLRADPVASAFLAAGSSQPGMPCQGPAGMHREPLPPGVPCSTLPTDPLTARLSA